MASIYDLKPKFQNLLRPLIRGLLKLGFTPNGITWLAVAGSAASGASLFWADRFRWIYFLMPAWLFARMALNAIDGMMAREHGLSSTFGAFLNECGDVVSDLFVYTPFAFQDRTSAPWVFAFVIGGALTEFCGVLGRALGAARHYEGPMGKSDRAFLVGALALATGAFPAATRFWPWVFGGSAALALFTCWNRMRRAYAEIQTR